MSAEDTFDAQATTALISPPSPDIVDDDRPTVSQSSLSPPSQPSETKTAASDDLASPVASFLQQQQNQPSTSASSPTPPPPQPPFPTHLPPASLSSTSEPKDKDKSPELIAPGYDGDSKKKEKGIFSQSHHSTAPDKVKERSGINTNGHSTSTLIKTVRMATSVEDITSLRLWKGIVAEFVGTLLLTLIGCGSCVNLRGSENVTSPVVQIALCFGLSVATIVWAIAHVSGGHINPAVTAAMLATRKISLAKGVFFVLFQLIGAVVGAGLLLGLTPKDDKGQLGMTNVNEKLSVGQAVGVEFFITFVLVFTVFSSCDGKRRDLNGSTPLAIGLSVTMCHLFAIDYTGSSMNTARSFGPALVMGRWKHHWVYWIGPILGGIVAGLLYEYLFAVNASLAKVKACILSSDYDEDKFKSPKIKVRIIEEDPADTDKEDLALSDRDRMISSDPSTA